ncbi:MAG: hypothetical protein V1802_00180 [Candidatus Aenigmatarchaeota archaeon]
MNVGLVIQMVRLVSDGTGIYTVKHDGTRDYGCMNSFTINNKKIYDFNQQTGVLQVSMSPQDLEVYLKEIIGGIPESGDLELPLPPPHVSGATAKFKGVKRIESIPGLQEHEYAMKLKK